MAKHVHVVPHMHWDREWYFTTEESRILLVNNMEEIMQMLETNPEYPHYVLDGQTAVLEDYFDVKPENFNRVKALVQAGKLIIGPWYTQTDEMVVGGESILRNLLYGMQDCKALGSAMKIGYLPDSFGQSERLPQILNGFEIDRCIFWRGTSERHGTDKHNFYWQGETGQGKVLVHLMPLGYAIGKYLPEEKEALAKRMSKYMPVLEKGAVNEAILLPNGHDQMPIQNNIFEVMAQLKNIYPEQEFFLSRYEHLFEEIEADTTLNLATLKGELLDGKYMRVHRSIFSSRADLKSSNTRIENKITNTLEPLAAIAYSLGAEYPEGLLEAIWKELMKNHAHDSIGCCCSDKVHRAIENRFFLAEDKTDELIRFTQRKITDAIPCDKALDKLVAFNCLPTPRTGIVEGELITKMKNFTLTDAEGHVIPFDVQHAEEVDAGLIDRQIVHYGDYDPFVKYQISFYDTIPAMGYKAYLIQNAEGQLVPVAAAMSECAENEYYHITVAENGSLTILDKQSGQTYQDVLLLEDGSDDGDGYDFSPLEHDFIVTSQAVQAQHSIARHANKSTIRIAYTLPVPKDLESRKQQLCDASVGVQLTLTLTAGSPTLALEAEIDNGAKDHRVRLLIPQNIGATCSVADNQFGEIRRPVRDAAMDVWQSEGWDERPDSIYPMLSYVASDATEGLAVLSNSVREYEIIGEAYDTLAITLFRSVGFLGKEELFRRPGRPSGIKMPTPDSQLLGRQKFSLALTRNAPNLAAVAKRYLSPITTYNKMPYNAMKLNPPDFTAPYAHSLLAVESADFIFSAMKKAQGQGGYVLRGYQVAQESLETQIIPTAGKAVCAEVKMNEQLAAPIAPEAQGRITLPKCTAKSYYITK
ncbi:MAG: mannosylglycerate hydrolase [Faecalibacterium sp.]